MSQQSPRYRWFVVTIFFFFMLLHQTDKLMIGSLQVPISETFKIGNREWGFINTGALIVATILYPIWGYLYDRYARAKLLALASLIWGATTWLSSVVRTYPAFIATRASTGVDDSSYPGLFTLIADYFEPTMRGKAEPEFEGMEEKEMEHFHFSWHEAKEIFKKKTMWFVFAQGFVGNFPWNVITYFFFGYLMTERGYDNNSVLFTMAPVILILAAGYFIGGSLGDVLFKRTNKGRIIVSSVGVLMGAIFLYLAMTAPIEARTQFFIFMCLTAVFMPLSSPNVIATVYDVTVPEVRSTAQAAEYFIENTGAAFAPAITGILAEAIGLSDAILTLCITAWILCFILYTGVLFFIDGDIKSLRNQMAERAKAM